MSKWKQSAFCDVLTIVNGKSQKQVENPSGKYPIYGSGGMMGYADNYLCEADTVVIGRKGTINRPIFVQEPFWNVDTAFGLRANDTLLLPKYLFYFCKQYDFETLNTTVTIPSLTKANLLKVQIPLPSLPIQKKIADVLDRVSALIEKRKTQIAKLDLLVKSRFIEMFDEDGNQSNWPSIKLSDACKSPDDIKCGPFGTQLHNADYQREGIAVYAIPQVNSAFERKPTDFLTSKKAEHLNSYSLLPGDIAMSRKGNVGTCALFPETLQPGVIHSDVLRIRVDCERVNPTYLVSLLHFSQAVKTQIEQVSQGAIMAGINVSKLKNIIVTLPPPHLQNRFADFVRAADKSKFAMRQSLNELEMMYKALAQSYFG